MFESYALYFLSDHLSILSFTLTVTAAVMPGMKRLIIGNVYASAISCRTNSKTFCRIVKREIPQVWILSHYISFEGKKGNLLK